jgi:undecaprenyl diphosphate synthase
MRLLKKQLLRELETLMKNNIRFQVIGDISRLPEEVLSVVNEVIRATENNSGMVLTFALSYGARQEITAAVQKMALAVKQGQLNVGDIDQDMVSSFLESSHLPDPDLILRTSGESRLSNFFLWQAAYSELFVTDTLWPDFNEAELDQALEAFTKRERRFGRILDENHAPAG